jgi:hypothetical protein
MSRLSVSAEDYHSRTVCPHRRSKIASIEMPDLDQLVTVVKEVGGAFKFGSGVLGKSAIAVGIVMLAVLVAVFRLHSDASIIAVIIVGAIVLLIWFFSVLVFAAKHPDLALLEGAEWTGFQRFRSEAKDYQPSESEKKPSALPSGAMPILPRNTNETEQDK